MDTSDDAEHKTERLHLLIAPSELALIEDWRWKHRV